MNKCKNVAFKIALCDVLTYISEMVFKCWSWIIEQGFESPLNSDSLLRLGAEINIICGWLVGEMYSFYA